MMVCDEEEDHTDPIMDANYRVFIQRTDEIPDDENNLKLYDRYILDRIAARYEPLLMDIQLYMAMLENFEEARENIPSLAQRMNSLSGEIAVEYIIAEEEYSRRLEGSKKGLIWGDILEPVAVREMIEDVYILEHQKFGHLWEEVKMGKIEGGAYRKFSESIPTPLKTMIIIASAIPKEELEEDNSEDSLAPGQTTLYDNLPYHG